MHDATFTRRTRGFWGRFTRRMRIFWVKFTRRMRAFWVTPTRRPRLFWVTSMVVTLVIGVAIGVTAGVDFGGEHPADSALADGQATSTPAQTSTPQTRPPSSVPLRATPPATTATPEATPKVIVFTGQGGKATETFSIEGKRFEVRWTTEVEDPGAFFFLSVFQEGQAFPVAEASFSGSGSDSSVVRAGPGEFYIEVITGAAWRIEVTPE